MSIMGVIAVCTLISSLTEGLEPGCPLKESEIFRKDAETEPEENNNEEVEDSMEEESGE